LRSLKKRPNFLIILCDEERYPPIYESPKVQAWRQKNLLFQELMRNNGMEFKRHYAATTACSPSRASLFTGQYPSLHGVTQTTGIAKEAFDPDVFWLDPNTVPTMGAYFRAAGYRTFYKGKWHISDEDILIPGTHHALPSYNPANGIPDQTKKEMYLQSNRLHPFGFSGWIGPEPHGKDPHNSGSSARIGVHGRDSAYSQEAINLLQMLQEEQAQSPWLMVISFVNPHDITLFGSVTEIDPLFEFEVDETVPFISPPPTADESLNTKPRCQKSYLKTYPKAFQPIKNTVFYRQLYYQLQKNVDQEMLKVFHYLRNSSLYSDTIVIFTSDHGELLGAHGGLHQKWYSAYEEALHVPLIIHNPLLFAGRHVSHMLTSHVDILPTLLGHAEVDVGQIEPFLRENHTEVHPLVGRDLSPFLLGTGVPHGAGEPIYFMTDDDPTKGLHQTTLTGQPYPSVIQPNHIETVIESFPTDQGDEIWKYSRYFDNQQFWSDPGKKDETLFQEDRRRSNRRKRSECINIKKTKPVPDEIEMYNLTQDPLETKNLAHPQWATPESRRMEYRLAHLLANQRVKKRLEPRSGTVPGNKR
jgi:arylsulfatase A-like enzyme